VIRRRIVGDYLVPAATLVGVLVGIPAAIAGEVIALPFAVGCGFAGGGLREACPKETIWEFTPFVFIDLHKHVWVMVRKLGVSWQLWLLLAPVALELLRQALGGRFGGYGLYLVKGKPVYTYDLLGLEKFRWAGKNALTPGKHTIMFDFKYDGPGPAKGGTGVFTVDGKELAKKTIKHTIPLMMTIDETFDIGVDTRTAVDSSYTLPFRFTGTIDKLTFKLGPSQLSAADKKAVEEAYAKAND